MIKKLSNKQFQFWTNWLLAVNLITVFTGPLIAFFGNSFLFAYHNEGTKNLFFGGGNIPAEILTFKNWLFGIIGATISGFHLLIVFIAHFAFREKQIWARNAIALAMVTWFALDSGISLYYGAYYNVYLINLPSFVIIVLPLIVTWKEFSSNNQPNC